MRLVCLFAVFIAISGCSGSSQTRNGASQAYDFGLGLQAPGPAGVYADPNPAQCCWMGKRAIFTFASAEKARQLEFTFFAPQYPAGLGPEAFTLRFDGQSSVTRCCYDAGLHDLLIPLPSNLRNGPLEVTIEAKFAFVPKDFGMNGDVRSLSVIARKVAIQ